jgi:hypothetical protein
MSYPMDRLAENSVVRNFRITAILASETLENKADPERGQATVNQQLTVQKQPKKATRKKGDKHE